MHDLTGKNADVQEIVERLAVYLFARASDTVLDKLSYIETRTEDICELSTKIRSSQGTNITDCSVVTIQKWHLRKGSKKVVTFRVQGVYHVQIDSITLNILFGKTVCQWKSIDKRYFVIIY